MSQIAKKCPITVLRNTFKNSWIRSMRMTPKLNEFFLVLRYICGKIFTKIRSGVKLLTDIQTNAGYSLAAVIKPCP